jgi:MoaA/NifB/PqqE/SkfB family radical SAM enzyme
LLLEEQAGMIAKIIDDVIVSFDGPPEVHDRIRRVKNASSTIAAGITALRRYRKDMTIRARCTVQKANHDCLCDTAKSAQQIGMNSISFLAADVSSAAFNRPDGWNEDRQQQVLLHSGELEALEQQIELLIHQQDNYAPGFIVESPDKLRRIAHHFRAWLEGSGHVAPHCNAPWVSAVIEATGDVRPCFFHQAIGNIHERDFDDIVNGPEALSFREHLDVSQNPICQKCVCSLYLPQSDHI